MRIGSFTASTALFVLATVGLALMASAEEFPRTQYLSARQQAQLYGAICSVPPKRTLFFDKLDWVCAVPRDYPTHDPFIQGCPLIFQSDEHGQFAIFYGQFSDRRRQAVAIYRAACQPHSNGFGVAPLFDIRRGGLKFIKVLPVQPYEDDVAPPATPA